MPKYGSMWLTWTRRCLSESRSRDSWYARADAEIYAPSGRILSLTVITAVTKLKSISIKAGSELHQEECDLRCLHFSFFPPSLSLSLCFLPSGYLLAVPWGVMVKCVSAGQVVACLCGFVCLCVCVCFCERACPGANECVSCCEPIDHREGKRRGWKEEERGRQVRALLLMSIDR